MEYRVWYYLQHTLSGREPSLRSEKFKQIYNESEQINHLICWYLCQICSGYSPQGRLIVLGEEKAGALESAQVILHCRFAPHPLSLRRGYLPIPLVPTIRRQVKQLSGLAS